MTRCFELRKLLSNLVKGLLSLLPFRNYLSNVSWVKGKHRVWLEVELIGCAEDPVLSGLRPGKEVLAILICFFNRAGFRLGYVSNQLSRVVTHLVAEILGGESWVLVAVVIIIFDGPKVLREAAGRAVMGNELLIKQVNVIRSCCLMSVVIVFRILHINQVFQNFNCSPAKFLTVNNKIGRLNLENLISLPKI